MYYMSSTAIVPIRDYIKRKLISLYAIHIESPEATELL